MADYLVQDTELTGVANHIRAKGGTSELLVWPDGYEDAIDAIHTGGILQSKSVTPTESAQTVTPDTGYDGLSQVSIGAISKTYVGSDIPRKSSSDLTASGATVTVPSGYYASQASKSVASGSVTVNTPSVNSSGLVTATATVGAGYVAAATPSKTLQLTTQAAQTITPGTTNQTIAAGKYLTGTQTIAGDSNLVAANIAEGVSIFGVTGTHSGGGGGTDVEDSMVTRTISGTYENSRVTTIGTYAFQYCQGLSTVSFQKCTSIDNYAFQYCHGLSIVSFPVCTTIGNYTFNQCTRLTTASFPECTSIGDYAFYSCTSLITVSFPVCTTISSSAFYSCTRLTTASFPKCTHIGGNAFRGCASLTTVSFPECTSIGGSAFNRCTSLISASFPECTSIGDYAFGYCSSLTTVSFPVCTHIGGNAFRGCARLTTASFPVCTSIGDYAFGYCSSLTTVSFPKCTTISSSAFYCCYILISLYLTGYSYVSLAHSNAFSSTPIGGYSSKTGQYGSIYVPASMLASYKTKTNWTYFSSRMVGV